VAVCTLEVTWGVIAGALGAVLGRWASLGLLFVWGSGAAALAAWRGQLWRAVSQAARAPTPLVAGREARALDQVTRRSSRPRHIELLQCPTPCEPGVYGVLRPRLLWPIGLSDRLGDAELEAVLAHEAVHVDRHDNLAAAVQMVVETTFWFFPPVWWLGGRLLDERERACDEDVLRMGTDERRYAAGIVQVCGFCLRAPAAFVAGVGGSSLNDRIERILRRATPDAPAKPIRLLLAAALATVIAAPFGTGVLSAGRGGAGGQDTRTVYQAGEGITLPKVVKELKPAYTPAALKARIQGSIGLDAIVLETGAVGEVTVVRSLDTEQGLDDEAVKALKQWQFEPGMKDGTAARVRVEVEMTFKLE
jgi:TonB family protein